MDIQHANPCRLALWFSVHNDLKYLSHRDTMTLWTRALARTPLPVRYSQGFNPHMKLTLPLPRSVGMASDRELLITQLDRPISLDLLMPSLQPQLPEGIALLHGEYWPSDAKADPQWAQYEIALSDSVNLPALDQKIAEFNGAAAWPITRTNAKTIDLKEAVDHFQRIHHRIEFEMNIHPAGTPRIGEIRQMLNLEADDRITGIRRTAVGYPTPPDPKHVNQERQP